MNSLWEKIEGREAKRSEDSNLDTACSNQPLYTSFNPVLYYSVIALPMFLSLLN